MGNFAEGFLKVFALILAFIFGFMTCVGILVGAGLIVYKGVSYDSLRRFGVDLPDTSAYLQKSDVSLTSMTIEKAVKEVQTLAAMDEPLTLAFLIDRYGIILPEAAKTYVPDSVLTVPLTALTTKEGLVYILDGVEVSYVYAFVPEGVISDAAKDALAGKTFYDVVRLDLGYLLEDVRLGYLLTPLGVSYELVDGVYVEKYADPENPTVAELLAPLSLGPILSNLKDKNSLLDAVTADLGEVMFRSLLANLANSNATVAGILGNATVGDLLEKNADGSYKVNVYCFFEGRTVGEMLGYTPVYFDEGGEHEAIIGWQNGGSAVTGIKLGLASCRIGDMNDAEHPFSPADVVKDLALGYALDLLPVYTDGVRTSWTKADATAPEPLYAKLADKTVGELTDGGLDMKSLFDGMYVGELMGYTPIFAEEGDAEYDPDKTVIKAWDNGDKEPMDSMTQTIAECEVSKLLDGDLPFDDFILSDLLGLHAKTYPLLLDGVTLSAAKTLWYNDAACTDEASGVLAVFAERGATVTEIANLMNDLKIADVLGYTEYGGILYEGSVVDDGGTEKYNLTEVTGLFKALGGSGINNLADDVGGVQIGDVIGYTYDTVAGKWYEDTAKTLEAKGLMVHFADLTVDDLSDNTKVTDAVSTAKVGEALGYTYDAVTDKWYEDDALTTPASGIMGAISDSTLNGLSADIETIKIGTVLNWHESGDTPPVWLDETDAPASGIMLHLADLTIDDLGNGTLVSEKIQEVKIGEALDYTYDPITEKWYEDAALTTPASGIMGVLADTRLSNVDGKINTTKIGELMGKYYDSVNHAWYDDAELTTPVSPKIMNKVSDATLTDVDTVMDNLTLGDVLPDDAFNSGFFKIIKSSTATGRDILVTDMADAGTYTFTHSSMADLMECGLLEIADDKANTLDLIYPDPDGWRSWDIQTFLNHLLP